uniref:Uncharacterized protein n=1 Tax=Candidatus Kentrum sp. FW TaxID=2126338 RepID=A0A450TNI3_9GAMM|nr:MAG: hypothetical protein BECKFW1821C_GA0114237_101848 [Candidatus Kentron sp. FW]
MSMRHLIILLLMLRIGRGILLHGRLQVTVDLKVHGKVLHLRLRLLQAGLLILFESSV